MSTVPPHPPVGDAVWIDASAGVAGDMLLAALLDAGADLAVVRAAIEAVLPHTVTIAARTVHRAGLRAVKVDIEVIDDDQPHRTWAEIESMLTRARICTPVRQHALAVFTRLARAEARVHGIEMADVHFHEVGAWDSIADVVGCAAALADLGARTVSAGPVAVGSGRVSTAHGDLAVPAPATLELSAGWTVTAGGDGELATPTGMALIRTLAHECGPLPPMQVRAVGVGAGTRDPADRANVVRVVVGTRIEAGRREGSGAVTTEELSVLEANVDDLDPRVWPEVVNALLAAGAADAWLAPIVMKKGRPAHTLSVLCAPERAARLREVIFAQTTSFGVREHRVQRTALAREWHPVQVDGQTVRIKVSRDATGAVRHLTPEFEDALAAANALGRPVREILAAASRAAPEAITP